jgi:hypothetical protein
VVAKEFRSGCRNPACADELHGLTGRLLDRASVLTRRVLRRPGRDGLFSPTGWLMRPMCWTGSWNIAWRETVHARSKVGPRTGFPDALKMRLDHIDVAEKEMIF